LIKFSFKILKIREFNLFNQIVLSLIDVAKAFHDVILIVYII